MAAARVLPWFVSCLLLSRAASVSQEKFSEVQKSHVKSAILFFEESLSRGIRFSLTFRPFTSGPSSDVVPLSSHYLLPDVIVWDPLRQFCDHLTFYCPECSPVLAALHGIRWKDGRKPWDMPRQLWGTTGHVLLVSRVYICTAGHQTIAHDPAILSQIGYTFLIPFVLFHRSGLTRDSFSLITAHFKAGLSLAQIENLLCQMHYTTYVTAKTMFMGHIKVYQQKHGIEGHVGLETFPSRDCKDFAPGRTLLSSCFILNHLERKWMFDKRMASMTANKWLSADHTFKVAANIGFWWNKKWVRMFDSLFIVLNENGVALAWMLTTGTAFSNVSELLKKLKSRIDTQGSRPSCFYVDNCCSWKTKLINVFGPLLTVKLDIFHAIQRVVKKIPKKNKPAGIRGIRKQMIHELRMIIRDPRDKAEERQMETPSPEILQCNVDSFLRCWNNTWFEGEKVLPPLAVLELDKLKVHMKKGCLSFIPKSAGTSRNEQLHQKLKKAVGRSRLGLPYCLALLDEFFYGHNERKLATLSGTKTPVPPVEHYYHDDTKCNSYVCDSSNDQPTEHFGLPFHQHHTSNVAPTALSSLASFPEEPTNLLELNRKLEEMHGAESLGPSSDESDEENLDCVDSDGLQDDTAHRNTVFTREETLLILQKATNLLHIQKKLKGLCGTTVFSSAQLQLAHSWLLFLQQSSEDTVQQQSCLDSVLEAHSMEKVPMPKNGNCFFLSVAFGIKQLLSNEMYTSELMSKLMQVQDCSPALFNYQNCSVDDLAALLRKALVNEFLTKPNEYAPFLQKDEKDYNQLSRAFLCDGHFSSELGNAMPKAMANILGMPLVIFTDIEGLPVIPIIPTTAQYSAESLLYLAFTGEGPGHYDGAVLSTKATTDHNASEETDSTILPNSTKATSCSCGRGAAKNKSEKNFCVSYSSGCKCFQGMSGCGEQCRCYNCKIQYGQRSSAKESSNLVKPQRKRRRHHTSSADLKGTNMLTKLCPAVIPTVTSSYENIVLECIIHSLSSVMDELDASQITAEYHQCIDILHGTSNEHLLSRKNVKEVKRKLLQWNHQNTTFQSLLLTKSGFS